MRKENSENTSENTSGNYAAVQDFSNLDFGFGGNFAQVENNFCGFKAVIDDNNVLYCNPCDVNEQYSNDSFQSQQITRLTQQYNSLYVDHLKDYCRHV